MTKGELIQALQDDSTPDDKEIFHDRGNKKVSFRIVKIGIETEIINGEKKRKVYLGT